MNKLFAFVSVELITCWPVLANALEQLHHLLASDPPGYPAGPTTWLLAAREVVSSFHNGSRGTGEVGVNAVSQR